MFTNMSVVKDIGTTLWAFATLEYFDEEIYRAIASRVTVDEAYTFQPQELSNSVWALATAGVEARYRDAFDTTLVPRNLRPSDWSDDPVTICFEAAANELMRRPHQFKSQEIKDVCWSFSKVSIATAIDGLSSSLACVLCISSCHVVSHTGTSATSNAIQNNCRTLGRTRVGCGSRG